MSNPTANSARLSILAVLTGLGLIAWFLFSVFLSGDPLLSAEIWKQTDELRGEELRAWRGNPAAYKTHSLKLDSQMNPISISFAHWSEETGFPRSSEFTLTVEDPDGRPVLEKALRLLQKKKQGGSDGAIFEWTAKTATVNLIDSYLDVRQEGTYTFRLTPGKKLAGNHSRIELRLRKRASRPQWWMVFTGVGLVMIAGGIFFFSGLLRFSRVLKKIGPGKKQA